MQAALEVLRTQSRSLPQDPLRARALLDAVSQSTAWPDIRENQVVLAGVTCWQLDPHEARGVILHVHGGGFHAGSFATHAHFLRHLASVTKRRILFPLYRLAPEAPFPQGLDDVSEVLRFVAQRETQLVLSGDSAGGALALGAFLRVRPEGLHALALFSPWLDLTCTTDSLDDAPLDYLEGAVLRRLSGSYLGNTPPTDPLASPAHATFSELPHTFVASSTSEALRDEIAAFVTRARSQGTHVTHDVSDGLPHAYPLIPLFGTERNECLSRFARWLERAPS
jgi:monoterpene epsilon-lactone hydrolase